MATSPPPIQTINPTRFDRPDVLKALASASRQLAELKGVVAAIPNQGILINTLSLQEAKDSSAIENIVTTHDELFRDAAYPIAAGSAAAKEVIRYRQALQTGFERVQSTGILTNNHVLEIQSVLELNNAGYRRVPGTTLKDGAGNVVYTPPQDPRTIVAMMGDLERYMNDEVKDAVDPLIRMALIHHQFESIHPFYDGNGRTGRIINVLYLVKVGLLDIPVLYMSRHIVRTKARYYQLLQMVRERDTWEDWVIYMLTAVESTARDGVATVEAIRAALLEVKHLVRRTRKFYSQDLINSLFSYPYTKIQVLEEELGVSRLTATKYLDALADDGVLQKLKVGRLSYYVNVRLVAILTGVPQSPRSRT
jgi:Fic family protein